MTAQPSDDQPQLPPILQQALRTPRPPIDLATAARLREGILERIIEAGESSPLGLALANGMRHPVGAENEPAIADAADSAAVGELSPGLADRLRAMPGMAPSWLQVREAVLAPAPARRMARSLLLVGTGIAAAAALVLLLHVESPPAVPEIAVVDVQVPPASGFSPMGVLRHGDGR